MNFKEIYHDEMTDQSFKELVHFAKWMNKYQGHHPTILGGWAVFFYVKGLGSRDIDVLFPSPHIKHEAVNKYLVANGYTMAHKDAFAVEFFKEVKVGNRTDKIIIDACTPADKNILHQDRAIELPWDLAITHSKEVDIKGGKVYIPLPEVLLLYKCKAVLDREFDLTRTTEPEYLQSKIWKDYHDIIGLILNCDFDPAIIHKINEKHGFEQLFRELLNRLPDKKDVLEDMGIERNRLKEAIKRLTITNRP